VNLLAAARLPRLRAAPRLDAVGITLWGLRVAVVLVVVIGTIGSLIKARYTGAQWFDLVMFGLTIGSIYARIALGYTMVYGVLRMINFAHGEIVMSGAFPVISSPRRSTARASSRRARCRRWRRSSRLRS
jgi:branched-chain amino acid transport system permease protein